MYLVPHGWGPVGIAGFLLALCAYSRRGTSPYKYLIFILVLAALGGISYGGWRYWKTQRYQYGAEMAESYYIARACDGLSIPWWRWVPSAATSARATTTRWCFAYGTRSRRHTLKAASYEKYIGGLWKLPTVPAAKVVPPSYYRVDYPVFELSDSTTRKSGAHEVWVQSSLNTFGLPFLPPYGAVGFAEKER
jgi:hypothetical protein